MYALGTRPDDAELLTDADPAHFRGEPSNVSSHPRLDVMWRWRTPERIDLSVGRLDPTSNAIEIMTIYADCDWHGEPVRRRMSAPTGRTKPIISVQTNTLIEAETGFATAI
jgi:hypothetical protein